MGRFCPAVRIEILEQWVEACERDEALGVLVAKLSRKAFLDDIPTAVQGLAETLEHGEGAFFTPSGTVLNSHSQHRWKQGFSLRQLIRDWGNLNKVLVSQVDRFFQLYHQNDHAARTVIFERLADFTTEALSESVRGFEALRQKEAGGVARELQVVKAAFEQTTQSRSQLLREATHDLRGGLSAIATATAVLQFSEQPTQISIQAPAKPGKRCVLGENHAGLSTRPVSP